MYAEVIVPLSVDGIFTYSVPDELAGKIRPGTLVCVHFAGNKRYTALVAGVTDKKPEGVKLRVVEGIADNSVFFSERHLSFLRWICDYYMSFPGDVLRASLPVALRSGDFVEHIFSEKTETYISLAPGFDAAAADVLRRKAPLQFRILDCFLSSGRREFERRELLTVSGSTVQALKALCSKGVLVGEERVPDKSGPDPESVMNILSEEQERAFGGICSLFESKECVLLHGVTSSGKTEIYMRLVQKVRREGRQVLFLLPEIALTVQVVKRMKRVFGDDIGVYHSGITDRERMELWRRQCGDNPYGIILGVRSALFLPFSSLGLVIVDEEHDTSYKQKDNAPLYNGRDAAVMLARIHSAKVLLGSATPSVESYFNAVRGKYGMVKLGKRFGGVCLPEIVVADVAEERRKKMMQGSFSSLLVSEMNSTLASGGQAILYQNRRGYSTFVRCSGCGTVPYCPNCDVSLTYYKNDNKLMCRYCGRAFPADMPCVSCGNTNYSMENPGTESVEEEAAARFTGYPTGRMDVDVMTSKRRFRQTISDFEEGKTRILVGTQMVSKGLDFGGVRLVGVVDADNLVHFPDFRSEERAFSQLLQVAGRSGRRDSRGKVVIQTSEPGNRVYEWVRSGDYGAMFDTLSNERRLFCYPPYSRLLTIEMRHHDRNVVRIFANELAAFLRSNFSGGRIEGPAVPEVGRIQGNYRVQIMVKITDMRAFGAVKPGLRRFCASDRRGVKVVFDMDSI